MNTGGLVVSVCPTCGSPDIRMVRGSWVGNYKGETYSVKELQYYSCPNCGEKVYSPEAMRRIQEASPAFLKSGGRQAERKPRQTLPLG